MSVSCCSISSPTLYPGFTYKDDTYFSCTFVVVVVFAFSFFLAVLFKIQSIFHLHAHICKYICVYNMSNHTCSIITRPSFCLHSMFINKSVVT